MVEVVRKSGSPPSLQGPAARAPRGFLPWTLPWTLPWALACALLLGACGGPGNYAGDEEFGSDSPYHKDFPVPAEPLCEAARRVLLGEGYVLGRAPDGSLAAGKEFPREDQGHASLRVYASCHPRGNGATLYVTATEEHFDVKTQRESVSIGFPLLSPFSFGSESEADRLLKTRGETIREPDFYERFYRAVQRELRR